MDLATAANYFNDIPVTDAYTAASLFPAQLSSSLDRQPDGSISKRRIISVAPGTTIPTRRVGQWLDEKWLLGDVILDGFQGAAIRTNVAVKKVTDDMRILTAGEAALASAGVAAYAHKEYLKDVVNSPTDAQYDPFWEVTFSPSEAVVKGSFLRSGSVYYRVRSCHAILEGFNTAAADQLDLVPAAVVLAGTAYDPVTESTTGSNVSTTGLLFDTYISYKYQHPASPRMLAGDRMLLIAQSAATPKVGQTLTAQGASWRVESLYADSGAWYTHIRAL